MPQHPSGSWDFSRPRSCPKEERQVFCFNLWADVWGKSAAVPPEERTKEEEKEEEEEEKEERKKGRSLPFGEESRGMNVPKADGLVSAAGHKLAPKWASVAGKTVWQRGGRAPPVTQPKDFRRCPP